MFAKVKGTQDFLDLALMQGVLAKVHRFLAINNFSEIATPLLEHASLFERGLGNETDVVSKQMFFIASDKEEKDRLCLRPEATAGIMRAFLEHQHELTLPWKVYTVGPMFRYERPQKGRYRQLHQINLEAIGIASLEYDALFIAMLQHLFEEILGLSTFVLKINYLGDVQDRERYKKALREFLQNNAEDICATCLHRKDTNVLRVLDCKVEGCQKIYEKAPIITAYFSEETMQEWQALQKNLQLLGVTFSHDPFLVRGLDYYNRTVFEFVGTALGAQNALCGGGRYDGLAQELGSKELIPSIGVGIGLERLLLLCQEHADQLALQKPALHMIIPFEQEQHTLGLLIALNLTKHGLCTDILLESSSIKSKMKKANKLGAAYVVLIGQDELANNYVTVKHMIKGTEEKVEQGKLLAYLRAHQ